MAVNCTVALSDEDNEDVIFLIPNEDYTGDILSAFDADYYKYEMYENETMTFVIRIFPRDVRPIDAELTLYRITGGVLQELGTSSLQQPYNTFTYDGTPGNYRFCLTCTTPIDYELSVAFTDYPFTLFPQVDNYYGSYMPPFNFDKPAYQCDSTVYYELISGVLPDGLYISSSGFIFGIPTELDCQTLDDDLPSFTYFEESPDDGERARISTSYDFPCRIRAALVEDPATFSDRDFIICVRNNWDMDRDAFKKNLPNLEVKRYTNVEVRGDDYRERLPKPEPDDELCAPCVDDIIENIELSEIDKAKLCDVIQINPEFAGLIEINNGVCVPCENDVVVADPTKLFKIEQTDACFVCEEPVEIVGLSDIPETLCPIKQEKSIIPQVSELFEGVPDDCLTDLVYRMSNEKVCDGPIYCPERSPIYPTRQDVKISLPDICEKECE